MADHISQDTIEFDAPSNGEMAEHVKSRKVNPLANRNFRLLWMGEGISLFGDQFYLVALPWLVFELTGSTLALGTLLMVEGIPRAVFMLFGGVLTDRLSSRTVMLASNIGRLLLTLILTVLIFTHTVQPWMLFVIALLFGLADAFFSPAFMAMPPTIVEEDGLQSSNAMLHGTQIITQAVGPAVAGVLVKAVGIALATVVDAVSFICSIVALLAMRVPEKIASDSVPSKLVQNRQNMIHDIHDAFSYIWGDPVLKPLIYIAVALNFLFAGPMAVGPAVLAKDRFAEGSAAFGAMISALGVGAFIGMVLAGTVRPRRFALPVFTLIIVSGICVILLGYAPVLSTAVVLCTLIGTANGAIHILMMIWTQKRIAKEMMGRAMSLFGLASFGLVPISSALAGLLAQTNLSLLFGGAGFLLVLTCIVAALNPDLRRMES
jgi:MFS family permease